MKIALIDDPKCCYDCPFEDSHFHHYCNLSKRHIDNCDAYKDIAEWCELTEAPEKKNVEDADRPFTDGFNYGWNKAIDAMWGEK